MPTTRPRCCSPIRMFSRIRLRYAKLGRRYSELPTVVVSYRSMLEAEREAREAIELADAEEDADFAADLRELASRPPG